MKVFHDNSADKLSKVELHFGSDQKIELWIESSVELDKKADSWLFLLLPVCLQLGEDLEMNGSLSETAIAAFHKAKLELLRGHPRMHDIDLIYKRPFAEITDTPETRRTGLFYSGGLDSTYASEMQPEINTLISVWGFDIPITNEKHWQLTTEMLEPYAKELGRDLILVKTNIRELSNGLLEWGGDYHGTALSGVAASLSQHLNKVFVSAGFVRKKPNWGHSPSLYNAFNTSYQEIEETDPVKRIAKAAAMANNPRTADIRACYRNVKGLANCATCKKCVRTRLEFDLVDAKYRPVNLETRPSLGELAKSKLTYWDYLFYLEAFRWARAQGFKGVLAPFLVITFARIKSIFHIPLEKFMTRLGLLTRKPKKKRKSSWLIRLLKR